MSKPVSDLVVFIDTPPSKGALSSRVSVPGLLLDAGGEPLSELPQPPIFPSFFLLNPAEIQNFF